MLRKKRYLTQFSLCCLFIGLTIYFTFNYGVNVPFMDGWVLPSFFEAVANKNADLDLLFSQHNEHRIAFPRIIFSVLAFSSNWNIFYQFALSLVFALLTFILISAIFRTQVELHKLGRIQSIFLDHAPNVITCALIFSLTQYENWLWGFQMAWFLINLCLTLAVFILYKNNKHLRSQAWLVAFLPCFVASFSSAHGLLTWLAILPVLLVYQGDWRSIAIRMLTWMVFFSSSLILYLNGYHKPQSHPSLLFLLERPMTALKYFFSFIGSSVVLGPTLAIGVGAIILISFITLIIQFAKSPILRKHFSQISPWISLGLFSLSFAALTMVGRAGFGASQAMSSRYRTSSVFLAIAVLQIGRLLIHVYLSEGNLSLLLRKRVSRICFPVFVAFILFLGTSVTVNSYEILVKASQYKSSREAAKLCLELIDYMEDIPDNSCRSFLFPSLAFVQANVPKLEALNFRQFPGDLEFVTQDRVSNDWGGIYPLADEIRPVADQLDIENNVLVIKPGEPIPIFGWIDYVETDSFYPFVLISHNDRPSYIQVVHLNITRPDVQKNLRENGHAKLDWMVHVNSNSLAEDDSILKAWVYHPKEQVFIQLSGSRHVRVSD